MATAVLERPPAVPVGTIKSFGPCGPKYEVRDVLYPDGHGDWMVRIVLIESGEETEYRLSRLVEDPEAE
jgi:hypothetical protein